MNDPFLILRTTGFFPIVEIRRAESVRALVATFVSCGLNIIEIPLRTDAALDAIRIVRDEFPGVLIGAGTVLSPASADIAYEAGARFMLAPGFNPRVVDHCLDRGYAFIPGISSPTGVELALEKGLRAVKFFPAAELGGLRFLKAMAAPFSGITYVPTGGVDNEKLAEYLADSRVLACGGTWMAKADMVAAEKKNEIACLVDGAFRAVLGLRIDGGDAGARQVVAGWFPRGALIPDGMGRSTGDARTITIATNDVTRTCAYLEDRGFGKSGNDTSYGKNDFGFRIKVTERVKTG